MKKSVVLLFTLLTVLPVSAQLKARIDSLLTARYYRTPYDTNYVVRSLDRKSVV